MSSWYPELVPAPSLRRPISTETFTRDFLPVAVCYYTTALLVLVPRTFRIRLALLPVTLCAIFRAGTQLDFAAGSEQFAYLNHGLTLTMTTLGMRAIVWTFQQEPFQRIKSARKSNSESDSTAIGQLLLDALDLSHNLRGIGWTWSHGLRLPCETRNVKCTSSFLSSTLLSFLLHFIGFDFSLYFMQYLGPAAMRSPTGGSFYDLSVPPAVRYAKTVAMVWLSGVVVTWAIQSVYDLLTFISVAFLGQEPTQWPPVCDQPWISRSLNEFWTLRWHQLFRDNFISFGGKPIAMLTGRAGGVMGAFLMSGILHDFGLWGMGRGCDFQNVSGYFLLMGVGLIIEHSWKAATGNKVGGFVGYLWTMTWVLGWGHMLVEAWATRGLIGSAFIPEPWRPSTFAFGSLPMSA